MYSNFMFLDQFFFELSCKNTHTLTDTQRDSDEYSIVAFINAIIKNAIITRNITCVICI